VDFEGGYFNKVLLGVYRRVGVGREVGGFNSNCLGDREFWGLEGVLVGGLVWILYVALV
jgi:hypothetical protein